MPGSEINMLPRGRRTLQVSLLTGSDGLSGHRIRVAVSLSLATLAVRYCMAFRSCLKPEEPLRSE